MKVCLQWMSLTLALVSTAASVVPAVADEPTAEQLLFFETNIRPLFAEHCLKCHGPEKQWSNYRLDSRESMLKGGDFGTSLVPGKPVESRLIAAVRQTDDELSMPPKEKEKLTDRQIADLVKWIEQGAHFPADAAVAKSRFRDPKHWSFQAANDPPLASVKNEAWVKSPLDTFILAKLEAAGLEPAAAADRHTLIRRATLDLTGLPPTPEEVAAFLADERPDAFAQLVNRLLESPAYGERWGRHWLDVARYADSNGLDENVAHGNAWRYRDYVIAAINGDKPYRDFVREQLAGDLLPATDEADRNENLVATGFLSLGPKVLAEPDKVKMEMDIIDEQIETTGRAFLGLTLGCARCHDHKFDPIETTDYYGLAGIFKSTKTMESFETIAKWVESPLHDAAAQERKTAFDQQVAEKKMAIQKIVDEAAAAVKLAKAGETLPPELEPLFPDATKAELKKLRDEQAAFEKTAPEMPTAMSVNEQKVVDVAVHIRGSHLRLGDKVTRHVPVVFTSLTQPQFTQERSGRLELADWMVEPKNALPHRVLVNRVWRWHFGKGLVRSVDNFGLLGDAPTHPELLDWLAQRFIQRGTSLKELHRLIMNSATYQQGSLASAKSLEADPENQLWSRFDVRRLEAESIRDSLIYVTGKLERSMGGSMLHVKNREFFFDHTSIDKTNYNNYRRSIYLPIVRNNVYPVFQLFDYPDAAITSGDRASTTIAPQALMMLNSDLIERSSIDLAERVLAISADNSERVRGLYQLAYGRDPTEAELARDAEFLTTTTAALEKVEPDAEKRVRLAWATLCQSILAANEFIYVK